MARIVIYKPLAKEDIDEVFDYLALEAGLDIALRFEAGVMDTAKKITLHPKIGVQRPYSEDIELDLRMIPVSDMECYLLYYTPNETEIIVLRVIHGSRDMKKQFE